MAVDAEGAAASPERARELEPQREPEPFEPDPHRGVGYRVARAIVRVVATAWFHPDVVGLDQFPPDGPVIVAPVHRSFADFVFVSFLTPRKIFFMAKDELWSNRRFGALLYVLGAFPVNREGADREALRRAETVLRRGQVLVLFPEGMRQAGPTVEEVHEGAAFLAARTGAPVVPVGIGGSDLSMPKGTHVPRRMRIPVVIGKPIDPPARSSSGRVPRSTVHATSEALRAGIQAAYDEARSRVR